MTTYTNKIELITNEFTSAVQNLVNADTLAGGVTLADSANKAGINAAELEHVYSQAINGLLTNKGTVLNDLKPVDMLTHLRLKQTFKRHSASIAQEYLLANFDRPQAAAILRHISVTQKGLVFTEKLLKTELTNSVTYDCFKNKVVVLGAPTYDNETKQYSPVIEVNTVNMADLVAKYNSWLESLNNNVKDISMPYTDTDNTTNATTAPDATTALIDASIIDALPSKASIMAQKELSNSRDIVALKERDIKTSQSEIDALRARVLELETENERLFNQLSPSKQRKLKVA